MSRIARSPQHIAASGRMLVVLLLCSLVAANSPAIARSPTVELAATVTSDQRASKLFFPVIGRSSTVELAATVSPTAVEAGGRVTYAITVRNVFNVPLSNTSIASQLPSGFSYVSGSASLSSNQIALPVGNPATSGSTLTWSGLTVPVARSASFYGMHTFVQDHWGDTGAQLDRAKELMGAGAYVKQLLYDITKGTQGPQQSWINFVNGCYDRGLIPVVRLEGPSGNPWPKPQATSSGNYSEIAAAFARVVAGLPRRSGRLLYVEIWNEPNLGLEWGGQANPKEYGQFLLAVSRAIRALGYSEVRILNGGLSPGSGGTPPTGDWGNLEFIEAMLSAVPDTLWAFDVWAAHPYPGNHPPQYNIHDSTASTYQNLTIDSYMLELQRLANHGRSGMPVLLTETGYALGQNNFVFQGYPPIDENNRADYIGRALYDDWRRWPEVLGVCPYELLDPDGKWAVWDWVGHRQYDIVRALNKTPVVAKGELTLRFQVKASSTPGTYSSQISVRSTGGSVNLANAASVQVYKPVCSSLLRNGGFEHEEAWVIPNYDPPRVWYTDDRKHSGSHSMSIGIVSPSPTGQLYSSVSQTFAVPASATSLHISLWYYPVAPGHRGRQLALLYEGSTQVQTILDVSSNDAKWIHREITLYGYAGRTLKLYLGTISSAEGGVTGMYVDDVDVQACGPGNLVALAPGETTGPVHMPTVMPTLSLIAPLSRTEEAASPESSLWRAEGPAGLDALALSADVGTAPLRALVPDIERHRLLLAAGNSVVALSTESGRLLFTRVLSGPVGALAVQPGSGAIYALLPEQGEVDVLRGGGDIVGRVADLGRPANVVLGLDRAYIADSAGNRLVVLNEATYAIMAVQELPAAPYALALDILNRRLYAGQMGSSLILALDAYTLDSIGQAALGGLGYPQSLALDETGSRLYVAHARSPKYGAVTIINTRDMSVIAALEGDLQDTLYGSDTVYLDSKRGMVLLAVADGFMLLDAEDLAVRGKTLAPRSAWPGTMALDATQGVVYAAGEAGQIFRWESVAPPVSPR